MVSELGSGVLTPRDIFKAAVLPIQVYQKTSVQKLVDMKLR